MIKLVLIVLTSPIPVQMPYVITMVEPKQPGLLAQGCNDRPCQFRCASGASSFPKQTKLYELQAKVRQTSVERGAVEQKKNEFQEELRRQNELIGRIEAQHSSKLEVATAAWRQEKVLQGAGALDPFAVGIIDSAALFYCSPRTDL